MTAAQATSPPAVTDAGTANIRIRKTELSRVPIISQGRNLPQRVLVLATIMPMTGSLKASNTLAHRRMMPI